MKDSSRSLTKQKLSILKNPKNLFPKQLKAIQEIVPQKRNELIKNIETEIITCNIHDEEQICQRCGSQMKVIGKKYLREEV